MLVQWNPWRDLNRLEQAMNQLYQSRANGTREDGETAATATWQPAVDVFEDAERIVLFADLPGVDEKDLELSIDKSVLTVRGERRTGFEARGEAHERLERVRGPFARSFTLPPTVDGERVSAELKNGVLTLTLPKKREAQPRQIKVSLG